MNISISTTQWGDARQIVSRNPSDSRSAVINRNLIMALSTITLAGLMAIQAIGPAVIDHRTIVDGSSERSAEVRSGEDFLALEELNSDELLQSELSNTSISPGSSPLLK